MEGGSKVGSALTVLVTIGKRLPTEMADSRYVEVIVEHRVHGVPGKQQVGIGAKPGGLIKVFPDLPHLNADRLFVSDAAQVVVIYEDDFEKGTFGGPRRCRSQQDDREVYEDRSQKYHVVAFSL